MLKKYFITYKPFLIFLSKFLCTYLALTFAYECYLNTFDAKKHEVDNFTELVAKQTVSVLAFFHQDANETPNINEPSMKLFYKQKYVSRIIEGCNGLSVIILFVSFVVAFTGKWKHTIIFCLGGSLLIHLLNITRIALLCGLMFYFPAQEHFLHDIFFPLFIYGVVFILWVIWVNKFSVYAKKS